jgi:hypothetical protein
MSANETPKPIPAASPRKNVLVELLLEMQRKYRKYLKDAGFKNETYEDCTRPRANTILLALILFVVFLVVSICGLFFPTSSMKRVVIVVNSMCGSVLVVVFATDLLTSTSNNGKL